MSFFGIKNLEKSFGAKFSRRKFFGFSLSAGAAAVVAPAAIEKFVIDMETHSSLWPHQRTILMWARQGGKRNWLGQHYGLGKSNYLEPSWSPGAVEQACDRSLRHVIASRNPLLDELTWYTESDPIEEGYFGA